MMEVGRLCVKIAGRDAGKKCVIVDTFDDKTVLIDGETRRRKCNLKHLEPLKETLRISKGADHSVIVSEFKKMGIELKETKPRKAAPKPKQIRASDRKKMAPKAEKKPAKAERKAAKEESKAAGKQGSAEGTALEKAAMQGESAEDEKKAE
ncbi:50S ribosomal protein L14e [Candidatus Woesearchaeota archaeon]|nr:50S ribosomal protein L14e [Candidatus Woesearchaeota archaeon]